MFSHDHLKLCIGEWELWLLQRDDHGSQRATAENLDDLPITHVFFVSFFFAALVAEPKDGSLLFAHDNNECTDAHVDETYATAIEDDDENAIAASSAATFLLHPGHCPSSNLSN